MNTTNIGGTPYEEDCAQVGRPGYEVRAHAECRAYLNQITRIATAAGLTLPKDFLTISSNPHDFGTYYEVAYRHPTDEATAALVAFVEDNTPARWDAAARVELGLPEDDELPSLDDES